MLALKPTRGSLSWYGLQSYDRSPSAGGNRIDVADETSLADALAVNDLQVR